MRRPRLEVADVFHRYGADWRRANAGHVSLGQLQVMSAIEQCRSAALGGHVERCEDCGRSWSGATSCSTHCSSRLSGTDSLQTRRRREMDSNLYGAFPVKWCFWFVVGSLFGAGKPFFIPSPAIRFAERAEGVKGPKR